jgi:hypothetical protein
MVLIDGLIDLNLNNSKKLIAKNTIKKYLSIERILRTLYLSKLKLDFRYL